MRFLEKRSQNEKKFANENTPLEPIMRLLRNDFIFYNGSTA
jgi:hypothetical protein